MRNSISSFRLNTVDPYTAVKVTINFKGNLAFGRVFGLKTFNAQAFATAAHRPRDVVIIMDLSGSMRYQSLPGTPSSGTRTTSMQADVFPKFGHYSATSSACFMETPAFPRAAVKCGIRPT